MDDTAAAPFLSDPGERLEGRGKRVVRRDREEEERFAGRGGLPGGPQAEDLALGSPGPDDDGDGAGRGEGVPSGFAAAEAGEGGEGRLERLAERRGVVHRRADRHEIEDSRIHRATSLLRAAGPAPGSAAARADRRSYRQRRAGRERDRSPALSSGPDALVQLPPLHPPRSPRRCRGRLPQAPRPRGDADEGRRRHLLLHADGLPVAQEDDRDRPRGDGPDGRPRGRPADRAAEGALGRVGAVGPLHQRRHPLPPRGPQGDRVRARADGRGGGDRHGPPLGHLVAAAAVQPLPDPDEVPRRDPPPLRPPARARVPDEGRLLLRRRPEGPRRPLRQDGEGVPDDLRALRPRVRPRPGRLGRHRRLGLRGVHGRRRHRRGRARLLRGRRSTVPTSRRRSPRPSPSRGPARRRSRSAGPTPRRPGSSRPRGRRSTSGRPSTGSRTRCSTRRSAPTRRRSSARS